MHLKFSQDIESLLQRLTHNPLTVEEIVEETEERGFSLLISLLVIPFLFPMPPGLSSILGSGAFLIALQMALGQNKPWLPKRISRFQFPNVLIGTLLQNIGRVTRALEKITRPRWPNIAKSRYVWRINGLFLAWLAVLLMLPIPFTNPLPAVPMLLLAAATLEMDGLLMGVCYVLSAFVTAFFGFLGYALWRAPELLPAQFLS
ncbi:exopolysaccharide biosynthesis protein [Oscillatoria sp. FACHB-1406]|uniref:exopolysaccharide biosynthesis protein n=1 Tax=Oscillatoria sp. FACHB-1406 TaxID=2692846 RepID=UPI001684F259|nr:exopolysaccharide biosynthesis protein [Oscillatoria sp. FACHB-1406]MBD2579601.1 exopolysaccharide biosynthesis protein [Oscillatoria sp. FACHB-1406]